MIKNKKCVIDKVQIFIGILGFGFLVACIVTKEIIWAWGFVGIVFALIIAKFT